jgi:hypothetical protein
VRVNLVSNDEIASFYSQWHSLLPVLGNS